MSSLFGRRLELRPLVLEDFADWREVRRRNADWLLKWEPMRIPGAPDPVESRDAFAIRCGARQRERQLGTGYGYGIFVEGSFAGEINLSIVQRGPFQSSYVGYWIDEEHAGQSYMPEAVVLRVPRRLRGSQPASRADLDHPPQHRQPPRRREARHPQRGRWPSATSRSTACGRTTSATPSPRRSGSSGAKLLVDAWID